MNERLMQLKFPAKFREGIIFFFGALHMVALVMFMTWMSDQQAKFGIATIAKMNAIGADFAYDAATKGPAFILDTYKVNSVGELSAKKVELENDSKKYDASFHKVTGSKWSFFWLGVTVLANAFITILTMRWLRPSKTTDSHPK